MRSTRKVTNDNILKFIREANFEVLTHIYSGHIINRDTYVQRLTDSKQTLACQNKLRTHKSIKCTNEDINNIKKVGPKPNPNP